MKILGYEFSVGKVSAPVEPVEEAPVQAEPKGYVYSEDNVAVPWVPIRTMGFNGEKTPGELGNPINLIPDYRSLRFRAYEANLKSDIVKIITGKFFKWVVGSGLKLQAEPNEKVLKLEKIDEKLVEFRSNVEAYFSLYADSRHADFSGMCNLHDQAAKHFETKFLGGDVLTVLRVDDDLNLTVQVIDGQHIVQPIFDAKIITDAAVKGNIIRHGIELDKKGQHVAYYVAKEGTANLLWDIERIEARGKTTGCLMAWISYGGKHRIDHHRGIPNITAILEKVAKLDRYTEASVSSAEERAKNPYFIKHSRFSDGENVLVANIKRNQGFAAQESSYEMAELTAKNITSTENKTVYNMPIGSELAALDSKSETQYEPFFKAVFVQLCAAVDIPPEVALQQYNSNYSASRAAINGWGYIIDIYRKQESADFYEPVYDMWLYLHILKNKVKASGYLRALNEGNRFVVESYSKARFTGANMPHIDPLKEANAIRVMLGDKSTPLMSYEQASEQLGNGEWSENIKKIKEERKDIPELLEDQEPKQATVSGANSPESQPNKSKTKEKKVKIAS